MRLSGLGPDEKGLYGRDGVILLVQMIQLLASRTHSHGKFMIPAGHDWGRTRCAGAWRARE